MPDHVRDVGELLVHLGVALADPAVLAEQHAVVREQHHERVLGEPEVRQAVEEAAQPDVHQRDLGGVELAHAAQEALREPELAPLAGRRGERLDRLHAARARRPVEVDQPSRGVPGLVSVEGVDDERERLHGPGPVDPTHRVAKDLGGGVVLLVAVARVDGQVGRHARLGPAVAHRARQVLVDLAPGSPCASAYDAPGPGRQRAPPGRTWRESACARPAGGAGCRSRSRWSSRFAGAPRSTSRRRRRPATSPAAAAGRPSAATSRGRGRCAGRP